MQLHYSGTEQVKAPPALAWAFLDNPQRVARAFPELQELRVVGQQIEGVASIGSGFLKAKLKLVVTVDPDPSTGQLTILVRGNGMGSTLMVAVHGHLSEAQGGVVLDWKAEANAAGPLAKMSRSMVEAQAQALISRTFSHIRTELEADARLLG